MEAYGNCNVQIANSRRALVQASWSQPTSVDPTKSYTGTDWTSRTAIYAIIGPVPLTPNAVRGADSPPRLSVRVRARRTGGAGTHVVRVYAVGQRRETAHGWPFTASRA